MSRVLDLLNPAHGYVYNVAEGYHYASAWGQVSQGTGTWN